MDLLLTLVLLLLLAFVAWKKASAFAEMGIAGSVGFTLIVVAPVYAYWFWNALTFLVAATAFVAGIYLFRRGIENVIAKREAKRHECTTNVRPPTLNPQPAQSLQEAEARTVHSPKPIARDNKRFVLIDGTNVIWLNDTEPDIRILLAIVNWLLHNEIDFLCFFDASTPHHFKNPHYLKRYNDILSYTYYFVEITGKLRADVAIVAEAEGRANSLIISNDQYREYTANRPQEYAWLGERLVKMVLSRDVVQVHGPLDFRVMLPDDKEVEAIFAALEKEAHSPKK